MIQLIGKSGTGIGKSGTGIGKSGTGIGKSGTGIGKSGTGSRSFWMAAAMCVGLTGSFAQPALADGEPDVRVISQGEVVMVSVQQGDDFLIGAAALNEQSGGYYTIELYPAAESAAAFGQASTLVKGSGSGNSGNSDCSPGASLMVKGSGSGNSGEAACTPGASLMVKGSGSGNSGEAACVPGASLLVKGSGSGNSGDAACPPGASLMVKGSGSGNSGESAGSCFQGAWGVAELLFDEGGANLIVHRLGSSGFEEFLVAYLPGRAPVTGSGSSDLGNRGFVSVP